MSRSVDNSQDLLDSRDIIARIRELEDTEDEDDKKELAILQALADEASGYSGDWKYGATLVRDSYFETYARSTAEDLGLLENCDKWPATCIDWAKAAEELQQDYTSVDFDGIEYWVR